jgi:hypothetical protein
MKRLTLTAFISAMVLAIAPASALARHHHKRHHHRTHHARVVHKRFGDVNTPTTSTTNPTSDTAGTIDSFTGGVLTIKLNDGSTVSGKVTNDTEIECEAADNETTMHDDGDGGGDHSGSGDQSGGDNNSGDDNGAGENENENENAQNCSSSLTSGTMVRGAELKISSAGAVWEKVDLG